MEWQEHCRIVLRISNAEHSFVSCLWAAYLEVRKQPRASGISGDRLLDAFAADTVEVLKVGEMGEP